jgi:hypothetical protein
MSKLRAHLTWLAATTLTLQLGVMVAAVTAVCCGGSPPAVATSDMPCCKDGGAAHVCPLKAKSNRDPSAPKLLDCCDVDEQVLAALLGFAGVPEPRDAIQPFAGTSPLTPPIVEQLVSLVTPPESPPPRS